LLPVIDEHLGDMKIQVERMDRLLTDLLEYSLVGTVSGLVSMVDPEKVVENVCVLLQLPPGFEVVVEGDLPAVEVISTEFELVLRNLISNAIKHHDWDHGRIAVRGGFDGLDLFFEVSDDGPGIAPDHHQRIFEMFSTLRSRDEVEGSGMGLALIKKIVEGWRGRIAVISDAERRGTTFRFTMNKLGAVYVDIAMLYPRDVGLGVVTALQARHTHQRFVPQPGLAGDVGITQGLVETGQVSAFLPGQGGMENLHSAGSQIVGPGIRHIATQECDPGKHQLVSDCSDESH
jgi:hypothetical protein